MPRWRRLQSELLQTREKGDDSSILSDDSIELSKQFSYSIRRFYGGWKVSKELHDYEKELHDLAYRWHLKAKWSGPCLILSHINDIVGIMAEGDETIIRTPVEVIEGVDVLCKVCPLCQNERCQSPQGNEDEVRKWDADILRGLEISYGDSITADRFRTLIGKKAPFIFCHTRCKWREGCSVFRS